MNPLTNVKNITKINEIELEKGLIDKKSWHDIYKDSAWIFIGGLAYGLTEGDIIAVFSQYGEIVNINLVRDKKTGKTKGFCFLCYANQKSTVLAVDNFNGIKLCNRTIRVDHVANYKPPKEDDRDDDMTKTLKSEGCAPKPLVSQLVGGATEKHEKKKKKKLKKEKKEKKKKRNVPEMKELPNLSKVKIEKEDSGYDKYDTINHDSRRKNILENHDSFEKRKGIQLSKNLDYGSGRKLEKKYLEDIEEQKDGKYHKNEAKLQGDQRRSHSNNYKSKSEKEDMCAYNRDRESGRYLKHSSASNHLHSRNIDKYHRDRRDENFEKISRETTKNHSWKKFKYDSSEEDYRDSNKECSYNKFKSRKKKKDSYSSSSSSSCSSSPCSSDSDSDGTHKKSQKSFNKHNSSERRTESTYDEKKDSNSSRLSDEEKDNNRFRDKHLSRSERDRISHSQKHKETYDKYNKGAFKKKRNE